MRQPGLESALKQQLNELYHKQQLNELYHNASIKITPQFKDKGSILQTGGETEDVTLEEMLFKVLPLTFLPVQDSYSHWRV